MKLSRNRSNIQRGCSRERSSDGSSRIYCGLLLVILHLLLCIGSFLLGFRLSGETRFVMISITTADYHPFPNSIFKFRRSPRVGSVLDNRKSFTPTILSDSPPFAGLKSSIVHVGRHEILIRSWPHPDPAQITVAHRLIERVQQEQEQIYGVQERNLVVVVTLTYVRALQAVYLSCLIHTLQVASGPLVWIVVEAGGHSNETAELLSKSKLVYYHLAVRESMPTDPKSKNLLDLKSRLEGLRIVRDLRLDGVVIFVDDSDILDLELFDIVQKTDWFGTFSVGRLFHSEASSFSEAVVLHSGNSSIKPRDANPQSGTGSFGTVNAASLFTKYGNSPSVKEHLPLRFSLQFMGPVCSPEGRMIGWYAPFDSEQEQFRRLTRANEWAGFALNSRMFWDDVSRPPWINSSSDLLFESGSLPKSPLAFLWNNSYIEVLGDCGRNIMVWLLGIETNSSCQFPSRWLISPPLQVVVPSKKTPWSAKVLVDSNAFRSSLSVFPPPPSAPLLTDTITQHAKGRSKRAKSRKGKHRSLNTKGGQVK